MAEKRSGIAALGLSSILTIFAVLCLVVFTLLTLSSVMAERRLSDKAAEAVLDYYEAELEAAETLARLRSGVVPEGVKQEGDVFCYSHPISSNQSLVVEVELDGSDFTILRWQAVSTAQWQANDSLPVWDGESVEVEK